MIRYIACEGQVEKDGDAVGTLVDILDLLHVILSGNEGKEGDCDVDDKL